MNHWFEVDKFKGEAEQSRWKAKSHMSDDPQIRVHMYCHRSFTVTHTSKIVGFLFRDRRHKKKKLHFLMNVLRKNPNRWMLSRHDNANDEEAKRYETIRMSEPIRMMNAEKVQGGRNSKSVTGTLTHNYFLS